MIYLVAQMLAGLVNCLTATHTPIARALFGKALVLVLVGLGASNIGATVNSAGTPAPRRNVLIIYSWHDLMPWQAGIRAGLQENLQQAPEANRPNLYEERVDAGRIGSAASNAALYNYLREKYALIPLDVVIAESQSAANFLLHYPDIFPLAKHFAVNVSNQGQMQNEQVFVAKEDPGQALLAIPIVMPSLQHIFAIVENSEYGDKVKTQLLTAAKALPIKTDLDVIDNFSFTELYAKVQSLPPHSAILYFPTFRDRDAVSEIPRNVVQHLSQIANAPIFAHHDTLLGTGIVGGYLLSARKEGDLIARMALGLPLPESQNERNSAFKSYQFDDSQLKRWNISSTLLPEPYSLINPSHYTQVSRSLWINNLRVPVVKLPFDYGFNEINSLGHLDLMNARAGWTCV